MASQLQKAINSGKVVVLSKSYCPYCRRVKDLFSSLAVPTTVFELDELAEGRALEEAMKKTLGVGTVPQVFIAGERIGGLDNTLKLHKEGLLVPQLHTVRAL